MIQARPLYVWPCSVHVSDPQCSSHPSEHGPQPTYAPCTHFSPCHGSMRPLQTSLDAAVTKGHQRGTEAKVSSRSWGTMGCLRIRNVSAAGGMGKPVQWVGESREARQAWRAEGRAGGTVDPDR